MPCSSLLPELQCPLGAAQLCHKGTGTGGKRLHRSEQEFTASTPQPPSSPWARLFSEQHVPHHHKYTIILQKLKRATSQKGIEMLQRRAEKRKKPPASEGSWTEAARAGILPCINCSCKVPLAWSAERCRTLIQEALICHQTFNHLPVPPFRETGSSPQLVF